MNSWGAAGELPPLDCWPELCVEPRWEGPARRAITDAQRGAHDAADWACPRCGERIEGQFTGCWNCGYES
jgi:hypothetical protein